MKKTLILLISALFVINSVNTKAQIPNKAKHLQSIFIFNFMMKIQWPDAYRSGDFIIGVVGNTPLKRELDVLATSKKINSRTIVVKKFSRVSEITPTHLLFVPASNNCEALLAAISKKTGHRQGTLIVSEQENVLNKGSVINFVLRNKKIRFEINEALAERYGFKVSALKKFIN